MSRSSFSAPFADTRLLEERAPAAWSLCVAVEADPPDGSSLEPAVVSRSEVSWTVHDGTEAPDTVDLTIELAPSTEG